ncbi:Ankyrin repeat domain-containing protein 13C [Bienertia sinuspersici]
MLLVIGHAKGRVENKLKDLGSYLPLYKAVLEKHWNETRKFLDEDPIGTTKEPKDVEFVEKVIRRISPENLALTDRNGETALSVAAVVGNTYVAKLLVNKNPHLPNISGNFGFPIHKAAEYGERDMIWYLLEVTRDDIESSPFVGESGAKLLIDIITAEYFDIALHLVSRYPEMATSEVQGVGSPLTVLAKISNAFPSGNVTLKFLEQIQERRRDQHDALELVKRLCAEILELDDAKAFSYLQQPILIAAKLGTHEIIEVIVKTFPPAIWAADEENHNIFQLAVLHRRENVFNLIYRMSDNYKHLITRYVDHPQDNNILHLAGKLPSSDRLNLVSGAALQVQRELHCTYATFPNRSHKQRRKDPMDDAISLFSSVTCILTFLSILTSRYSEDDFLYVLPSGLIVGFSMLFISITSMMIAFSSAIYLVFGHIRAMIVIIAGSVLVLPVTLYVLLPPLHRILFKSDFIGHRSSRNQSHRILH